MIGAVLTRGVGRSIRSASRAARFHSGFSACGAGFDARFVAIVSASIAALFGAGVGAAWKVLWGFGRCVVTSGSSAASASRTIA